MLIEKVTAARTVESAKNVPDDELQEDIERFFRVVMHDLRGSLRALKFIPDWIEEDLEDTGIMLPATVRDHLDMLRTHSSRMDTMLLGVQAYVHANRDTPSTRCRIDEMIDQIVSERMIPDSFAIEHRLELPELEMSRVDLSQLLSVLLDNAVRHHDADRGTVRVTLRRAGEFAELAVEDDGPGIPASFHDRVFGVLTTLQPRDEVEAAGMGLAIARRICNRIEASIEVCPDSRERGTRMVILFPSYFIPDGR